MFPHLAACARPVAHTASLFLYLRLTEKRSSVAKEGVNVSSFTVHCALCITVFQKNTEAMFPYSTITTFEVLLLNTRAVYFVKPSLSGGWTLRVHFIISLMLAM